jgi:hypothetical protein
MKRTLVAAATTLSLTALVGCGSDGGTVANSSALASKIGCTGFLPDDNSVLFPGASDVGSCQLKGAEVNLGRFANSTDRDKALAQLRTILAQRGGAGGTQKPPIYGKNWIANPDDSAWQTVKDKTGGKSA